MRCRSCASIRNTYRNWKRIVGWPYRDAQPVGCFSSFTKGSRALADRRQPCGIDTVALESTGVLWVPVFQMLADRGFPVCLVHARHEQNVAGQRTDLEECNGYSFCIRSGWGAPGSGRNRRCVPWAHAPPPPGAVGGRCLGRYPARTSHHAQSPGPDASQPQSVRNEITRSRGRHRVEAILCAHGWRETTGKSLGSRCGRAAVGMRNIAAA